MTLSLWAVGSISSAAGGLRTESTPTGQIHEFLCVFVIFLCVFQLSPPTVPASLHPIWHVSGTSLCLPLFSPPCDVATPSGKYFTVLHDYSVCLLVECHFLPSGLMTDYIFLWIVAEAAQYKGQSEVCETSTSDKTFWNLPKNWRKAVSVYYIPLNPKLLLYWANRAFTLFQD